MILDSDPLVIAWVAVALVAGGFIKGAIGFALPIVTVTLISTLLPVQLTLAMITGPIVMTNAWQAATSGHPGLAFRRFWPLIAALLVCLWISASLVAELDQELLYTLVGVIVVIFTATSLFNANFTLGSRSEKWAGPLAGACGGLIGGASTIWGPPMTMYFVALRLPKDEFIRAVGLVWFIASIPLVVAYYRNGILNDETIPLTLLACLPTAGGMILGQVLRGRFNQELFRKAVLVTLLLLGLNLVRRAVF